MTPLTRRDTLKGGLFAASAALAPISMLDLCRLERFVLTDDDDCPRIVPTEKGPFYPEGDIPADDDLTTEAASSESADGQTLYLFGKINFLMSESSGNRPDFKMLLLC